MRTARAPRTSSVQPSSSSRALICAVTGGWERKSLRAAALMLPSSTAVTK